MPELILEIVEGAEAGRTLALDRPLDVGRDPAMPIALLGDMQASRRHARLTPQDGGAVVEDLGSANGTFVNDQPIHSPRPVRPGDRVRVGLTVLEVRSPQQVRERPSAVIARPRLTELRNDVLAPATAAELGVQAPAPAAGFVPAAGAAQAAGGQALPPQPGPPLAGEPPPAPVFQPGVGFRAAETPAGYVPPEVVRDDEPDSPYGALTDMMDAHVKRQRNAAAFVLLGASGLSVLLYFGLT
jgi:hypothetical protein